MRIAIVSPFLDKRHGTERCIAEQAERLARDDAFEVHLYSQRIADLERAQEADALHPREPSARGAGRLHWHRVPDVTGPHLVKYLWWFLANQYCRWRDCRRAGRVYDLVYTPGVNCLDADVISVHVVFASVARASATADVLAPRHGWPRRLHQWLYHRLLRSLERVLYRRSDKILVAVSRKVARELESLYGQDAGLPVVYHGLDLDRFNPRRCSELRAASRRLLGLAEDAFAVLLIGNDLKAKGLPYLLEAARQADLRQLHILVVGEDEVSPYANSIRNTDLEGRVLFLPVRPDVEVYYAAADAYVGPSLDESFGLPPAEAMACGLPVILSRQAGASEIVTHDQDAWLVDHPADTQTLGEFLRQLCHNAGVRRRLGENAARTASLYTWNHNLARMKDIFLQVHAKKSARARERGAAGKTASL